jgi:hypothetical protein
MRGQGIAHRQFSLPVFDGLVKNRNSSEFVASAEA